MMILHAPRSILKRKKNKQKHGNTFIPKPDKWPAEWEERRQTGRRIWHQGIGLFESTFTPLAPSPALLFLCCPSWGTNGELRVRRMEDDGARWGNVMLFVFLISYVSWMSMMPVIVPAGWMYTSFIFWDLLQYRLSIFLFFSFVFGVEEEERIQNTKKKKKIPIGSDG